MLDVKASSWTSCGSPEVGDRMGYSEPRWRCQPCGFTTHVAVARPAEGCRDVLTSDGRWRPCSRSLRGQAFLLTTESSYAGFSNGSRRCKLGRRLGADPDQLRVVLKGNGADAGKESPPHNSVLQGLFQTDELHAPPPNPHSPPLDALSEKTNGPGGASFHGRGEGQNLRRLQSEQRFWRSRMYAQPTDAQGNDHVNTSPKSFFCITHPWKSWSDVVEWRGHSTKCQRMQVSAVFVVGQWPGARAVRPPYTAVSLEAQAGWPWLEWQASRSPGAQQPGGKERGNHSTESWEGEAQSAREAQAGLRGWQASCGRWCLLETLTGADWGEKSWCFLSSQW